MSDTPDAPFLPASVLSLVEKIAQILTRRRETVAIAESAAGGLLNAALLSWPGASAFYKGGCLVYTMDGREAFADFGLRELKSRRWGPGQVYVEMGERVRRKLGANWTLVEIGIAGPTVSKNSPNPAGTCEYAIVYNAAGTKGTATKSKGLAPKASVSSHKKIQTGRKERMWNMVEFTRIGLELLLERLEAQEKEDAKPGKGPKVKL